MATWSAAVGALEQLYHITGERLTPTLDVSAISRVTSSNIVWSTITPDGASFAVYARLDGDEWVQCSNNRPIPVTPEAISQ